MLKLAGYFPFRPVCMSSISSEFPIFLKLVFFSSLALTASSPVDTSPSSDLPSSSSPSFTPSSSSNTNLHGVEAEVRLLPPLLKDQAWGVHAQEAFLLFCLALGECCLPQ